MKYIIALGSNEHRTENLAWARKRLLELFPDSYFSPEETTEPIGLHRAALFSNQAARFTSHLSPQEVVLLLKAIEREVGRTLEEKKQEIIRLDIDLLVCDHIVYKPEEMKRPYLLRALAALSES